MLQQRRLFDDAIEICAWYIRGCQNGLALDTVLGAFYLHNWVLMYLGFTGFFQVIECVQVLFLHCIVRMHTVAIVQVLNAPVVHHVVVDLAVGEILVDIESPHPHMVA